MSILVTQVTFFFNDTATTEIYTLSLHDALPISDCGSTATTLDMAPYSLLDRLVIRSIHLDTLASNLHARGWSNSSSPKRPRLTFIEVRQPRACKLDRKSTRLNSSH